MSWIPVALTNVEDPHVLTSGKDETLYGIGSITPDLLFSDDAGATWEQRPAIPAVDLAVSGDALFAATEDGLQVSTDRGMTFSPVPDAPLIYLIAATPSEALIGVGADSSVWSETISGGWEPLGVVTGTA